MSKPSEVLCPSWNDTIEFVERTRHQGYHGALIHGARRDGKSSFLRFFEKRWRQHATNMFVCTTSTQTYHNNWSDCAERVRWTTQLIQDGVQVAALPAMTHVLIFIDDINFIAQQDLAFCQQLLDDPRVQEYFIIATATPDPDVELPINFPIPSLQMNRDVLWTVKNRLDAPQLAGVN